MVYSRDRDKRILLGVIIVLVFLVITLLLLYVNADTSCELRARALYEALNVCYGSGRVLPIYNIS